MWTRICIFLTLYYFIHLPISNSNFEWGRLQYENPLKDRLFEYLPFYSLSHTLNIVLSVLIIWFVYMCFKHKKMNIFYYAWDSFMICNMVIRPISYSLTLLPDPSQQCHLNRSWFWVMGACHDLLFSGHCSLLFIVLYLATRNRFCSSKMWIIQILYSLGVVMSHSHYSIDLLYAPLVAHYTMYWILPFLYNKMAKFDFYFYYILYTFTMFLFKKFNSMR